MLFFWPKCLKMPEIFNQAEFSSAMPETIHFSGSWVAFAKIWRFHFFGIIHPPKKAFRIFNILIRTDVGLMPGLP